MRKSVDLPQPDGPTSTTNSPSAIIDIDAVNDLYRTVVLLDVLDIDGCHKRFLNLRAEGGRLPQPPLTAPAVRPATICFWANMVSSSTGSVTMSAAAASGPQLTCSKDSML